MLSLISGALTPVTVEFGGDGSGDGIYYGVVPQVLDLETRTMAAWVYFEPTDTKSRIIMSLNSNSARTTLYSGTDGKIKYYALNYTDTFGWWGADDAHAEEEWIHVAVTRDLSSDILADPIIYINGSPVDITELSTPVGTLRSEAGTRFGIGKLYYGIDYPMEGKIADARIHNVILTSDELTTLYNGGDPDSSLVTRGLVFQGQNVKTVDYAGLLDTVMTNADNLIDNIYNAIGSPDSSSYGTGGTAGTPVLRVFP